MLTSLRHVHPLRWLAPIWATMLLIWGIQTSFLGINDNAHQHPLHDPVVMAYFSLLMTFHIGMYVLGFIYRPKGWQYLCYSSIQSVLVYSVGVQLHSWLPALVLLLPLAVEAIGVLRLARMILVPLTVYLVCLCLILQHLGSWVVLRETLIIIVPFLAFFSLAVHLFLQQMCARERAQTLLSELEGANRQLAASHARVEVLTLLTERQRMARELHDTLAQGLAGLILQLEAVDLHLQQDHIARATAIVHQAQSRARMALAGARCAIDDLRAVPDDVVIAVQEEIERFTTATRITCEADITALALLPLANHEHVVHAIAEGLANIARHAQARHVWIEAREHDASITVVIRDDGVGFVPAVAVSQAGHYGLLGLRERARLAGGELAVLSEPGAGTTLRLRLLTAPQEMLHA